MTSITIDFSRQGEYVVAEADGVTVSRATAPEAARDLIGGYEAINGPVGEVLSWPLAAIPMPAPVGHAAVHSDNIREVVEDAISGELLVFVRGDHVDGSSMDERVIEPQKLVGNLLGAYDHLNDEFRNFRLDKLTYVSSDPVACDRWFEDSGLW